jgi:hypothetical protein
MNVKTKLDTNQPVFLLFQNKIHEVVIESINIKVNIHDHINITYCIQANPVSDTYTKIFLEHELHATKEDLLSTL